MYTFHARIGGQQTETVFQTSSQVVVHAAALALFYFAKKQQLQQLTPDMNIHVVEVGGDTRGTETVHRIVEWLRSADGADAFGTDPLGVREHLLAIAQAQGLSSR
jgi:hypothetical protein